MFPQLHTLIGRRNRLSRGRLARERHIWQTRRINLPNPSTSHHRYMTEWEFLHWSWHRTLGTVITRRLKYNIIIIIIIIQNEYVMLNRRERAQKTHWKLPPRWRPRNWPHFLGYLSYITDYSLCYCHGLRITQSRITVYTIIVIIRDIVLRHSRPIVCSHMRNQ
jgi:hypothetical protein